MRTKPARNDRHGRKVSAVMPNVECRLLYLDYVAERGRDLFRVACERDLEGIVAKWAHGTYRRTAAPQAG